MNAFICKQKKLVLDAILNGKPMEIDETRQL